MDTRGLQRSCCARRFRVGPLRCRYNTTAVLRACRRVNGSFFRIGQSVSMAVVLGRAPAAEVAGRTRGLQRGRKKDSGRRKQQQTLGYQALHGLTWNQSPSGFRIDHTRECVQGSLYKTLTLDAVELRKSLRPEAIYFTSTYLPPSVKAITKFMSTNMRS
jgi:hypothetical protein